jgi:hypothetical protein
MKREIHQSHKHTLSHARDAPLALALAPPQPSLKQGKPDLKDEICGEAPLNVQQHIPVK